MSTYDREKRFIEFIHSRKFLSMFLLFMCIVFATDWIILVKNENRITKIKSEQIIQIDESDYVYDLEKVSWMKDDISITKDYVNISGWLIKKRRTSR